LNIEPLVILREIFGYPEFRGAQADIVQHVTKGGDALVLMPTGGGKSLCFQIPALARHAAGLGLTVVVSPLIALMHDQVGALHEAGVAAAFLNSSLSQDAANAIEQRLRKDELVLLYAAPERVTSPRFLALLDHLAERKKLSLFAIDEAHCVSQWGHDFRPEYQLLRVLHERYGQVPRMALTATADALTRADMLQGLRLEAAAQFISSFDRPNIHYAIVEKKDPFSQLLHFINGEHRFELDGNVVHDSGIVYCQSRKRVEEIAQQLNQAGIAALPYHAGLSGELRQANQDRFLREESDRGGWVMVATIAFGMGIDKPDVRFVAHIDMPKNIEGYYQETGRAGRDGAASKAWMCYGLQDVVNQRRMIDESPATEDFKQIMRGKLDALLGLAEATDCRRVRLLTYFGEAYAPDGRVRLQCGHCDNCINPPELWDATDVARKLLSTVYRVAQQNGLHFGAGHIMDIVRGKSSEKIKQYGHDKISTFGLCVDSSEQALRAVLRHLIAIEVLHVDATSYNTLHLTTAARPVLKGEQAVLLRQTSKEHPSRKKAGVKTSQTSSISNNDLSPMAQRRLVALKAWRAEVASSHNLPAFVIFHDNTLRSLAERAPKNTTELQGISGIGVKKLEAYGSELLRVLDTVDT
jgi:ATP-dependent DNA helicase RecQ